MKVSVDEIESARDAIVAHGNKYGRTAEEAIAVFKETIRQLDEFLESEKRSINTTVRH